MKFNGIISVIVKSKYLRRAMISRETARPRFSLPKTWEAKFKHVIVLLVYWRATGRWTGSDCGGGDGTEPFVVFFLLVRPQSEPHLWPRACGSH